jgi:glycosyltransferase involved in cell wall biosynthesis
MRVVALLAAFNEERFIDSSLGRLARHGVEAYLIDNGSSDRTVELAERHLGRGLIAIEELPRGGSFSLLKILERKEHLAASLNADWLIHVDADEARLPPHSGQSLAQALAEVDTAGYNAVNFFEFTFVPTQEAPDHDHPRFEQTMRHYYAFAPRLPHRLNAWKRQDGPVDLHTDAGHEVHFPSIRAYPESFRMRHYLFLSREHAIRKYLPRLHDPAGLERGWHGWRARLQHAVAQERPELLELPGQSELRTHVSDEMLDASAPLTRHEWCERRAARVAETISLRGERPTATPRRGGCLADAGVE